MLPIEINVPDTIVAAMNGLISAWNAISMYFAPMDMNGPTDSPQLAVFVQRYK